MSEYAIDLRESFKEHPEEFETLEELVKTAMLNPSEDIRLSAATSLAVGYKNIKEGFSGTENYSSYLKKMELRKQDMCARYLKNIGGKQSIHLR